MRITLIKPLLCIYLTHARCCFGMIARLMHSPCTLYIYACTNTYTINQHNLLKHMHTRSHQHYGPNSWHAFKLKLLPSVALANDSTARHSEKATNSLRNTTQAMDQGPTYSSTPCISSIHHDQLGSRDWYNPSVSCFFRIVAISCVVSSNSISSHTPYYVTATPHKQMHCLLTV